MSRRSCSDGDEVVRHRRVDVLVRASFAIIPGRGVSARRSDSKARIAASTSHGENSGVCRFPCGRIPPRSPRHLPTPACRAPRALEHFRRQDFLECVEVVQMHEQRRLDDTLRATRCGSSAPRALRSRRPAGPIPPRGGSRRHRRRSETTRVAPAAARARERSMQPLSVAQLSRIQHSHRGLRLRLGRATMSLPQRRQTRHPRHWCRKKSVRRIAAPE